MVRPTANTAFESGISRHRTAIHRYRCSRPLAQAIADGLIGPAFTVFDYGCGRGGDIRYLTKQGIRATGWDPYYLPDGKLQTADVVNLGFVINVVEDPDERAEVMRKAYALAARVLIVSVRVEQIPEGAMGYSDGHITTKGTFQKIFTQAEFREYVETVLGRRAHTASLGVAYVFKDEEIEAGFIAARTFTRRLEYRADLIDQFARSPAARRYVKLGTKLGRRPSPGEFRDYPKLIELFGSDRRIERLFLRQVNRDAFDGSRAERKEDLLTYIANLLLEGIRPPTYGKLPELLQRDIRAIWGSYSDACREARDFLFSLGQPDRVRTVCQSSAVGKLLPGDLYFHRSVEERLSPLLRLVLAAARRIVGEIEYDVAKIGTDGRTVSLMVYEQFDSDPHPRLMRSVRVYLPRASYGVRDYSESTNPPILHRKDALVAEDYPHFAEFRALTAAEEQAGLLSQPNIGTREAWEGLLSRRGFRISGHVLGAPAGGSDPDHDVQGSSEGNDA